jgi:hypothetical protein
MVFRADAPIKGLNMEEKDVTSLLSSTSLLMEQFRRRSATIDQRFEATRHSVDGLLQHVPDVLRQAAHDALKTIPGRVVQAIEDGIDRPMAEYEAKLGASSDAALHAMQGIAQQVKRLERLHRHLVWKVTGVVGGSVAALLVAAIWTASHYAGVIRDNQLKAELVRAYNAADVTLCGEQLCANVDAKGAKFGERGQYRLVHPR